MKIGKKTKITLTVDEFAKHIEVCKTSGMGSFSYAKAIAALLSREYETVYVVRTNDAVHCYSGPSWASFQPIYMTSKEEAEDHIRYVQEWRTSTDKSVVVKIRRKKRCS